MFMNECQQNEKEFFEERNPDGESQNNFSNYNHEYVQTCHAHDDEHTFEFLVQDMFLDHFFP
jgi:hypothetical protein